MSQLKEIQSVRKAFLWYELRLRRFLFSVWGAVFCIICSIATLTFILHLRSIGGNSTNKPQRMVHWSSAPAQPIALVYPNYLDEHLFRDLQLTLPNHPLIVDNKLNEGNFYHTRGWLTKFNIQGLDRMRELPEMKLAMQFFDEVRMRDSNAFVMNLLIASEVPEGEDAVGAHMDDTVAVDHPDRFLAHSVSVLYVSVPDHMVGGQVEMWTQVENDFPIDPSVVFPRENVMVQFKGTALHRVRRFHSPSGKPRISLVVEQYRIAEEYYQHTVDFCLNDHCELNIGDAQVFSGRDDEE